MIYTLGMPAYKLNLFMAKEMFSFESTLRRENVQILKIFVKNDCHIKEELFTMNER